MDIHLQTESVIPIQLIARIKAQYRLEWFGTHGIKHWNRVYENGMKLAEQTGVNVRVVQLFSIFHDACRRTEGKDIDHGSRGALLARELRSYCPINDAEFTLLATACELHTNTQNHENIAVQACFDADRLDLGRCNITPDPTLLCTSMAKEAKIIKWAYHRSINDNELPDQPFGFSGYWNK